MPESPFILEGEQIMREGESRRFSIVWDDFTEVTSAGVEAYISGSSQTTGSGGLLRHQIFLETYKLFLL
jgi:hypothetical protein